MKILLDECVTKRLKKHLEGHEVITVSQKNWNGLRNGELMRRAVEDSFDILLTIDKKIQYQQNFSKYDLVVIILDSPSSKVEIIKQYLLNFFKQINSFERGKAYVISL